MKKRKETSKSITLAKIPSHLIKTKDKISNTIIDSFINQGEQSLKMEKAGATVKPITTKVTFTYEGVDIQARNEFTAFDREVHDSIVSLYISGNKIVTPSMVYRTMTGKTKTEFVNPSTIKEILKSIDKCLFSKIMIDATEELSQYNLTKAVFSGNLIYAKSVSLEFNGKLVNSYEILATPILYEYASEKNQLAKIPLKLLDTPLNKTKDTIVLQGYLIRRIESMKSPKSRTSNVILYETIYKFCKIETATRQKLERTRNDVKIMLDYWVQQGYISSYEETTQGRTKYSLIINF